MNHETTLSEVNEIIDGMAKISVAYLNQRLTNLENTLAKERADHAQRIGMLEMRLEDAGREFVALRKRVIALESIVSHAGLELS